LDFSSPFQAFAQKNQTELHTSENLSAKQREGNLSLMTILSPSCCLLAEKLLA
jgi:hypothetical protein